VGQDPGVGRPPRSAPNGALRELADQCGIQLRHRDGFEREVEPPDETFQALLHAMGHPVQDEADAALTLRRIEAERAGTLLEPAQVLWAGSVPRIRTGVGLGSGERVDVRLEHTGAGDAGAVEFTSRVHGGEIPLPLAPALGYHRIHLRRRDGGSGDREADGLLIVAPSRVFGADGTSRSQWSAFLPLYALGSERSRGVGDLTDLEQLLRWVEKQGGSSVATLPLMAAFLDEPLEPSPYAPVSRLFWNELYLDPTRVPEWEASPEARRLLASAEADGLLARIRGGERVPYRETWGLQRRLLDHLSEAWAQTLPEAARLEELGETDFRRFLRRYPDAPRYAAFRGVVEAGAGDWRGWPDAWRTQGIPESIPDAVAFRRHLYAQFRFVHQLEEVLPRSNQGAGLYLDLPLGAHPSGYDLWANPGLFAEGASLGAPPDGLQEEGQSWGLPPILPDAARREGYGHLRRILGRLLPHARILRIDHVMGLHRLYWVPPGESATRGAYVQYPAEELYAILALESHRHETILIGEDLGTVPPEIRTEMDQRGLRRMYVVPFEFSRRNPGAMRPVPPGSVASVGTHDTPPFAALWREEGIRSGLRAFHGDAAWEARSEPDPLAVLRRVLSWLGKSPAGVVVVNLEDLWLEDRPQNEPGTSGDLNWSRRARFPLEAFTRAPAVASSLRTLDRARRLAGSVSGLPRRGPAPSEQVVPDQRSPDVTQPTPPTREPSPGEPETTSEASPLSEEDLYLFNEGSHLRLYQKLGAQISGDPRRPGVHFAVWAPNAEAVSVVGDFNDWSPDRHPLQARGGSGIWEGFVPDATRGSVYKYHIQSRVAGYTVQKADPYGFRHETPPATASVVWDLEYDWEDGDWMESRGHEAGADGPISVYEVHLASWRRDPSEPRRYRGYRELAPELAEYVKELGFTHVELLPIMEHPFYGSWGYQTTGYFAPSSRQGSPQDFMFLVDTLHQAGIGVILDWVPSHFPTDEHGLGFFDGTHLFEHSDPRQGFHPDWESAIFNYGRDEVRSFLLSSALFWLDHYHVDGIRVDAVASMLYLDYSRKDGEWIPNRYGGRENLEAIDFLRRLNTEIYGAHPDVHTIAEESTAWPMVSRPTYVGGLGFGMKWDMGWMHDSLEYISRDSIHRRHHQEELTFRGLYAFNENFMLPLSHDEVVHGKGSLLRRMPGNDWEKRANLRLLLSWQFFQPGKKLLFMGCEIGQWSEWNHEGGVDWHLLEDPGHRGIQRLVGDLNRLYRGDASLHRGDFDPDGFDWIDASDREQSVLAFLRRDPSGESAPLLAVFNFTPVPRENHRIGVPHGGRWAEILNTDAHVYGGGGWGNLGGVDAVPIPFHGRDHSVVLTLPPLSMVVLRPAE